MIEFTLILIIEEKLHRLISNHFYKIKLITENSV